MITCVIRHELEPCASETFVRHARSWGVAMPRCGADLVGYFVPHEGSATTACGIYHVAAPAACKRYSARLREDPLGRENFAFAARERFIRREDRRRKDRLFLRLVSTGDAEHSS